MSTRRMHRVLLLATFVAVAPVLAGCADFDPDKLDIFGLNEKKKLPGERKPLFPEGVPGVTQGIPQEYIKGNQPPPDAALTAPVETAPAAEPSNQTAAVTPVEEPKAKPKPKPKKTVKQKPKPPATAAAPVQPVTQSEQQPAAWPEPSQNSSTAPWPSAPPPGTFTR